MSTKRSPTLAGIDLVRGRIGRVWTPDPSNPATASAGLAVTVALLRALRDRGLLSEGEIDDLFGEAAELLRDTPALHLLNSVRGAVEHKEEE